MHQQAPIVNGSFASRESKLHLRGRQRLERRKKEEPSEEQARNNNKTSSQEREEPGTLVPLGCIRLDKSRGFLTLVVIHIERRIQISFARSQ